jgi:hypothetical protein
MTLTRAQSQAILQLHPNKEIASALHPVLPLLAQHQLQWHWAEPRLSILEFHTRIRGNGPGSRENHGSKKSSQKLAVYTPVSFR